MYAKDAFVIATLVLGGISTLVAIGGRLFLMLSVGTDMKAKGLRLRALWMALTFFIPWCAIVYVIVRKWLPTEGPQYCESCHATNAPGAVQCASCGSGKLTPMVAVDPQQQKKKTKAFAIVGGVLYCLSAVLLAVSYAMLTVSMFSYLEDFADEWKDFPSYYYGEYDDDDYDDFFENFEEYPYDEEDFEEFFDNFEEYDHGDMPFDFNDNNN